MLGFAAGFMNAGSLSDGVRQVLNTVLTASAPWGIPVTNIVILGIGWSLYAKGKSLYRGWNGEDEDTIDGAEEKLSWALLMSAAALLCDLFFFSVAVVHASGPMVMIAFIVEFFVGVGVATVLQQKIVDLEKQINPEKRGSVYDMKFQKKWMESCDEAEQRQIGQACRPGLSGGHQGVSVAVGGADGTPLRLRHGASAGGAGADHLRRPADLVHPGEYPVGSEGGETVMDITLLAAVLAACGLLLFPGQKKQR